MSVTAQDFADYANQGNLDPAMDRIITQAADLVDEYMRANVPEGVMVPPSIEDQAIIEAAANLWDRRLAPGGQLNQAFGDGEVAAPIRISRDPLAPVRPLLAQWTTPLGFA